MIPDMTDGFAQLAAAYQTFVKVGWLTLAQPDLSTSHATAACLVLNATALSSYQQPQQHIKVCAIMYSLPHSLLLSGMLHRQT
jgi:hypothetical protein